MNYTTGRRDWVRSLMPRLAGEVPRVRGDVLETTRRVCRMSAYGYKQTYRGQLANVCFTPNSGHSEAQERVGLKKQTSDVRLAPSSGLD